MFYRQEDLSSDTYNGADCGHYRWSQTGFEVDIKVVIDLKYFYKRLNMFTELSGSLAGVYLFRLPRLLESNQGYRETSVFNSVYCEQSQNEYVRLL